jgi:hypothetical protein
MSMLMSRRYTFFIIKKKKITVLWYTIDSHNNFFIGMDRTIQKKIIINKINNKITILFYECHSHYPIMDHVKIKNNIPVLPNKWIYA